MAVATRVGICAVAQTTFGRDKRQERFQGMARDVVESLQKQTGIDFSEDKGIGMSISVSDDVFDARTISNNPMTDVLGAHFGCEEKVAQEGAQALYYGRSVIQSGHTDLVLVLGDHIKRTWKQIIYFNSGAHAEDTAKKVTAAIDLPDTGGFQLDSDIEIISDERGVRIARDEGD